MSGTKTCDEGKVVTEELTRAKKAWKVILQKHHEAPRRSETRSHTSLDWHGGIRILPLAWCGRSRLCKIQMLEKPVFSESQGMGSTVVAEGQDVGEVDCVRSAGITEVSMEGLGGGGQRRETFPA